MREPNAKDIRHNLANNGARSDHDRTPSQRVSLSVLSETPLIQLLNRFWEIEELMVHTKPFTEEHKCENNFRQTTNRDETVHSDLSVQNLLIHPWRVP